MSGTIYGVLASVFVSLYAIYIKRILPVVDGNVWLLTFYNNVNAMLLFIPMMMIFGEFPVILAFDGLFSPTFWFLMTLGGIFGCAIGYVTGLQVSWLKLCQRRAKYLLGYSFFYLFIFFNFNQLPAGKEGFKNRASLQALGPSYFVRALVFCFKLGLSILDEKRLSPKI